MTNTKVHFHWRDVRVARSFPTAASLHSHTLHSRERLDFLPRIAQSMPVVRHAVAWQEDRYRARHGHPPDYSAAHWTPPFNEREALRLERRQIETRLGLAPLVSLTDHDNIDAGLHLRLFEDSRDAPVSLEWTVPYEPSFLHVGVHNLPPDPVLRHALFDGLAAMEDVLVVLNHPMWDENGIGSSAHRSVVRRFLGEHREWIHAIEVNGFRGWPENLEAIDLAASLDLCLLSGGDRHASEPNAVLNLTQAATFAAFVDEVRRERRSEVLFLPQYREPLRQRYAEAIWEVMRDYPEHPGRERWTDRFFFRRPSGEHVPLSSALGGGDGPSVVRVFMTLLRLAGREPVRTRLRAALGGGSEVLP